MKPPYDNNGSRVTPCHVFHCAVWYVVVLQRGRCRVLDHLGSQQRPNSSSLRQGSQGKICKNCGHGAYCPSHLATVLDMASKIQVASESGRFLLQTIGISNKHCPTQSTATLLERTPHLQKSQSNYIIYIVTLHIYHISTNRKNAGTPSLQQLHAGIDWNRLRMMSEGNATVP